MDISPLATLNNYRNGEHSICQKPWKKNTKLKPGNVDRAGKREVILKENKDRIAIIDAIQGASTNELKALAEIKNAILSDRGSITQLGENQGKVSRGREPQNSKNSGRTCRILGAPRSMSSVIPVRSTIFCVRGRPGSTKL